ncbi:MAG: hypothetical protein OJJ21_13415 [Ferrovibrio sp.]|uniref:hypothetical protein n=1 Tax=Ferrovibrio sp. TaxID=1917215 RepID=UPI0026369E58|nr:hypothetical protein [Ferrovibrio sp.]MCW0234593.1 hypothetical protein [Ferrovibrio sp.]
MIAAALVVALVGCTRTHQLTTTMTRPEGGQPQVVLMPLDVELSVLSAGGGLEPRADWTETAKSYLLEAIRSEKAGKQIDMVVFQDEKAGAAHQDVVNQLIKLHGVVGNSILVHQYVQEAVLPSKGGKFEWSVGPSAKALKEIYKSDYALFVWVRDSYSSGGRVALMLLAGAAGIGLPGGQQLGFASLVELETGNVVWFNLLHRGIGDLRSAEGAVGTAQYLLAQLPK